MGVFTTKINPDSKKNHGKNREKKKLHFPLKKLKTCRAWCANRACSSPETADDFGCLFGPFLIKIYMVFFLANQRLVFKKFHGDLTGLIQKLFTLFHCHTFFVCFFVRIGDLSPKKSTQKTGYGVGERCWILKSRSGNC